MNRKEILFIVSGWAIMISSIAVQPFSMSSSWFSSTLWISNTLVFLASVLAGLVIFDLEKIVIGYMGALALSFLLFCICVVLLPIMLGSVALIGFDVIFSAALVVYAKFVFPIGVILGLIGAFLGAFLRQAIGS